MAKLDAEEIEFLRYIKSKKKGVPTDELRSKFNSELIRWGNANYYIQQHAVTKNYQIADKGVQALQFEDTYGEGGTVDQEHPTWKDAETDHPFYKGWK